MDAFTHYFNISPVAILLNVQRLHIQILHLKQLYDITPDIYTWVNKIEQMPIGRTNIFKSTGDIGNIYIYMHIYRYVYIYTHIYIYIYISIYKFRDPST